MRNVEPGVKAPRVTKIATALLASGLSLSLAGCSSSNALSSDGLKQCKDGWEATAAFTMDPSADSAAMQQAIAELINKVDGSKADEYNGGYATDTIPHELVGAATAILKHSPNGVYLRRSSELQSYNNEFCTETITGSTYRTPAFMSAVGALASAGIDVLTPDAILPLTEPTQ